MLLRNIQCSDAILKNNKKHYGVKWMLEDKANGMKNLLSVLFCNSVLNNIHSLYTSQLML